MLKGHIDNVADDNVSGWLYSQEGPVAGARVLAFCGAQCIGASEVGIYREDLYQAGLDDGRLGFQIFFDRSALVNPQAVHVRMEGSDFSLLIRNFWSTSSVDQSKNFELFTQPEMENINWMASRGWLNQGQFALAKAINRMGVYQKLFSLKDIKASSLDALVGDAFTDCLSIMLKRQKKAVTARVTVEEMHTENISLSAASPGIVGLYNASFSAKILEGRHRSDMRVSEIVPIFYDNSIYQVMIVHLDCCESIVNIDDGVLKVVKYNP